MNFETTAGMRLIFAVSFLLFLMLSYVAGLLFVYSDYAHPFRLALMFTGLVSFFSAMAYGLTCTPAPARPEELPAELDVAPAWAKREAKGAEAAAELVCAA